MNLNEQIHHVELSLDQAKRIAEFGEAIKRLERNPDFKKVIFDGYFTDEARRLVFLTADTTLTDAQNNNTLYAIRAIGELRGFLMAKKTEADIAAKEINDHSETLEELRQEDANGDSGEEA